MSGEAEFERYGRQVVLPGIGGQGQRRLGASCAVVVGCGALGTVASELLVRAGVGRVRVVDRDLVETSNLQRQTLFAEADEGEPKAVAAARRLGAVNSRVAVEAVVADLTGANALEVLGFDGVHAPGVILDGTDNFETRFLVNEAAVERGVALVYGGAVGTRGMVGVFADPRRAGCACLRCAFDPPAPGSQETCETAGVLGAVSAMVGAAQACEAIKVLVRADQADSEGAGSGGLWSFDGWAATGRRIELARDPGCPCCVLGRRDFLHRRSPVGEAVVCGKEAVSIAGEGGVDLGAVGERLARHGPVSVGPFVVRAEVEGGRYGLTVFGDGRVIVRGTRDVARARSVCARFVGS